MNWRSELVESLAQRPVCGYYEDQSAATEPTAMTALGLLAHGRERASVAAIQWLLELQQDDGSLGVRVNAEEPRWPTSLATLAWQAAIARGLTLAGVDAGVRLREPLSRAVDWISNAKGTAIEPPTEEGAEWPFGHDTMLIAWPWVIGTHSWIEPTCLHVLALRATGNRQHPRSREAVALLYDRQIPSGGCNYGNTLVLGQMLRPHVQPSGMLAAALADEPDSAERLSPTLSFLRSRLATTVSAASLAWAVIGLKANRSESNLEPFLQKAYERERKRTPPSPYRLALISLAAAGRNSPLFGLGG